MIQQAPAMQRAAGVEHIGRFVQAPEDDKRIRIVEVRAPWDLRLIAWTERQVLTPHRIRRAVHWLGRWLAHCYIHIRAFAAAVLGPRVNQETYDERMAICNVCPQATHDSKTAVYCLACSCPRWHFALLRVKNRYANWRCPRRYHPGDYPSYGLSGCGRRRIEWTMGGEEHGSSDIPMDRGNA